MPSLSQEYGDRRAITQLLRLLRKPYCPKGSGSSVVPGAVASLRSAGLGDFDCLVSGEDKRVLPNCFLPPTSLATSGFPTSASVVKAGPLGLLLMRLGEGIGKGEVDGEYLSASVESQVAIVAKEISPLCSDSLAKSFLGGMMRIELDSTHSIARRNKECPAISLKARFRSGYYRMAMRDSGFSLVNEGRLRFSLMDKGRDHRNLELYKGVL
ncbi:hypothetical protein Dimus_037676 [Dionaea muscipula]